MSATSACAAAHSAARESRRACAASSVHRTESCAAMVWLPSRASARAASATSDGFSGWRVPSASAPLLIAIGYDAVRHRRVHAVYAFGLVMLVMLRYRPLLRESDFWPVVTHWVADRLA
jgi:hypothetical protein